MSPGRYTDVSLTEDAADRPHVDREGVDARAEQDLRRAVPSRRDVVGQRREVFLSTLYSAFRQRAREAKVADLREAVAVEEEVGRLHVAM